MECPSCSASFGHSTPKEHCVFPTVTTGQQHTFVIRVRKNKAEWVNVQTGQTVNEEIEVFCELKDGDQPVNAATDANRSGHRAQVAR